MTPDAIHPDDEMLKLIEELDISSPRNYVSDSSEEELQREAKLAYDDVFGEETEERLEG